MLSVGSREVLEGRVVRAIAQRVHNQVCAFVQILALFIIFRLGDACQVRALETVILVSGPECLWPHR